MRDPVEGQRVARRVAQRACRLRKSRSTGVSTRAPLIVRYSVRLYTSITQTHAPVRVQMHTDEDCIYNPATHTFGFSVSADARDGPDTRLSRAVERSPPSAVEPVRRSAKPQAATYARETGSIKVSLTYFYTPPNFHCNPFSTQQAPGRGGHTCAHAHVNIYYVVVCSLRFSSSKYRVCVFREAGRQPSARPL